MGAQDFTTSQHFCDSAALFPLHSWLPALLKPHVPFRGARGQPDGKSLSKRKHGSKRRLTTIWALRVPNSPVLAVALKSHPHSPSLQRLHFSTSLVLVPGLSQHCEPQCPSLLSAFPVAQFPKPFGPPFHSYSQGSSKPSYPQPSRVHTLVGFWPRGLRIPAPTLAPRKTPVAAQARSEPRPLGTAAGASRAPLLPWQRSTQTRTRAECARCASTKRVRRAAVVEGSRVESKRKAGEAGKGEMGEMQFAPLRGVWSGS